MSRSFGDLNYVKSGLIADPEITKTLIKPDDMYLMLGTDGFWEVIFCLDLAHKCK